jgi:hypothetical protein
MKRVVFFLVIIYLISAFGAWVLFSKNVGANVVLNNELAVIKTEFANAKTDLDAERIAHAGVEKKIADARVNSAFLALALCPTLEATDKEALCIKNSTEWLSQTILAGTALTSTDAKIKMDALLVALGKKTKPTAKQLYEMLRPIEVDALNALSETLR